MSSLHSQTRWSILFILPCLLGLFLFTYLPVFSSFGLSFTYWNLLGKPQWVGLENYQAVLSDPLFWQTFQNTWFFVLISSLIEIILALWLAVWIHSLSRGQHLFRLIYFIPFITPMVGMSLVWGWLYDPQSGFLNQLLATLGYAGKPIAWLYQPETALWAVIALKVWKYFGYDLLLFLAGLQAISTDLEASAALEGASSRQIFWNITLPMLTPTLFFITTMALINGFQVFDAIYLLTQGGPEHHTEVLVYWMYKNAFEFYKIGPASAIAYILFLIILSLTLIQWWCRKRWVFHES